MAGAVGARVVVCLLASGAMLTAACATAPRAGRFTGGAGRPVAETTERRDSGEVPADSLEAAIGKIRHLSQHARPIAKRLSGATIEDTDPRLAAVLLVLATAPAAASHRLVAEEYVRLGILDAAYDHYRRAVRLDPRDAAAFDGLARIWRDWGVPALGLADAHRAVYFAPASPEARNTLGTLLQNLGQPKAARAAYERAVALQPGAAYAFNNLCYLSILEGRASQAIDDCQRAIALDGTLKVARRNLALGYAAAGRPDLSRAELFRVDSPAAAHYNLGIISLARRDYPAAAAAFETACKIRPWPGAACARAQQLRTGAHRAGGRLSHDPNR